MGISAAPQIDDGAPQNVGTSVKERIGGIIGGIAAAGKGDKMEDNPLVQEMDKQHQRRVQEAQKHYKDYQTYHNALFSKTNPETGQPLTAEEGERYFNLMNLSKEALTKVAGTHKETKGKLQKFFQTTEHLLHMNNKQSGSGGSEQNPQGGTGANGDTGSGGGGGSRLTPPPSWGGDQSAVNQSTGPAPPDINDPTATADAPMLRQRMAENHEMELYKQQQEILKNNKIEEAKALTAAKTAGARTTYGPAISVRNARELAKQGKSYLDKEGQPIDLTTLPDSMGLKFIAHGGDNYYEPFSPNSKTITVGNETYAVSPMDVEALADGAGTDLGQHRTSTATSSEKGVSQEGLDVTHRTSTPTTPGVAGRGGKQAPSAPASRIPAPPAPGGRAAVSGGAGSTSSSGLLPTAQNAKRAGPIREAMTQVIGDPTHPEFKPLGSFMQYADDPAVVEHVGAAFQRVLSGLKMEEDKSGSFMTLLKNYGGVPESLVQSQVAVNREIIGKLTPKEAEIFNAGIAALSTWMGMRVTTGGSAAKFSVDALDREVPLIGFNTFDSKKFRNMMGRLTEEISVGSRTVPLTKLERKHVDDAVKTWNAPESKGGKSRLASPPKLNGSVEDTIREEIKKAKERAKKPAA